MGSDPNHNSPLKGSRNGWQIRPSALGRAVLLEPQGGERRDDSHTSETYVSKAGALTGIESCRTNSAIDARYERLTATNGQAYFVPKAGNHETIGRSEMYSSTTARENGIASCKQNGPTAPTEDNT